jgi:UDP-3-O-[3-hydroxymyristoyl] glucosamine N-acyltransferase
MRLSDIPSHLGLRVERDAEILTLGFVTHDAPGRLVFVEDAAWLPRLAEHPGVAAVLAPPALAAAVPAGLGLTLAESPRRAFYLVHNHLVEATQFYARHLGRALAASARVHPTAVLPDQELVIGERVVIQPHAVVFPGTVIGDDSVIGPGAVLGSDGFQIESSLAPPLTVRHGGGVRLGARVEIDANTVVDRALFGGYTEFGDDTKVDNLVHVAHGARIGRRCRIVAHAMIAGSAILGDDVWIGPCAAVSDSVRVGDGAYVSLGAVVTRDVPPGARVTGNFAVDHGRFLEHLRTIR